MSKPAHISLRMDHIVELLKAKPGTYYSDADLSVYLTKVTETPIDESNVRSAVARIQDNGIKPIHRRGKATCYETEEVRTNRLAAEARDRDEKMNAQSQKNRAVWEKLLAEEEEALKVFQQKRAKRLAHENANQESILRVVA